MKHVIHRNPIHRVMDLGLVIFGTGVQVYLAGLVLTPVPPIGVAITLITGREPANSHFL